MMLSDLENIGEVASQCQFQQQVNIFSGVVDDVNIFMDAFTDNPVDGDVDASGLNDAVFSIEYRVCEVKTGSVETELAGVNRLERLTIEVETIGIYKACIDGKQTLFGI